MSFIQLNYEIFKNIKYFFSNEKNITMDVVSVAERSDDLRSSTTKSKASEACWGLLLEKTIPEYLQQQISEDNSTNREDENSVIKPPAEFDNEEYVSDFEDTIEDSDTFFTFDSIYNGQSPQDFGTSTDSLPLAYKFHLDHSKNFDDDGIIYYQNPQNNVYEVDEEYSKIYQVKSNSFVIKMNCCCCCCYI